MFHPARGRSIHKVMTADFERLLAEHGLSDVPDTLRRLYEDRSDQMEFPCPVAVEIRPSEIDGLGLFATSSFITGAVIAPMRIGSWRTPAGRYTNHSDAPNALPISTRTAVFLKSLKPIATDDEITVDYRKVLGEARCAIF